MSSTPIHAIYEGGVFRPIEPVNLPEHSHVKVEPLGDDAAIVDKAEADEFWTAKSLDELAAEQGVQVVADWQDLFGSGRNLWDDDESFDAFLGAA